MKNTLRRTAGIFAAVCILAAGILSCKTETDSDDPVLDKTAPADVTNLAAVAGDSTAILSWTNPADADFYGVEVSATPAAGTLANPVVLTGTTASLTVSGLTNATEYTFTVKTIDKSLNTSTGTTVTATPADSSDKTAPAEVTNLAAVAGDSTAILSWTNPTDADFYGVEVSASPVAGTLANPVVLTGTTTSLTVSGLANATEYTFTVKTIDKSLNISTGVTKTATPTDSSDKTAPAEVTNLAATNKDASVLLTWTDNSTDSDIYGYEVSWDKDGAINRSAMSANTIMVAQGNGGCYISGLTNGTEYTFTVKAVDTSGNKSTGVSKTITPEAITVADAMKVTLTPSSTAATIEKVTVTVVVTTSDSIKKVVYKSGTFVNAATLLANSNAIDITNTLSFDVTENATYSVAAIDSVGREEISYITINNIGDKIPDAVKNLSASFCYANKQITVTWTDPSDSDLDYIALSYAIGSADATTQNIVAGTQSYTITVADTYLTGTTYTIKATAVDATENKSTETTTSVTTLSGPAISTITLDRYHLSCTDSDRNIVVTVTGSNFDTIASQSDTTLKIQYLVAGTTSVLATLSSADSGVTINTTSNTATATISTPADATTVAGTDYTVRVKLCGTVVTTPTTTFNVSATATVSSIVLSTSKISVDDVTSSTTTTATVTGTNLDIDGPLTLRLYDSTGTAYGTAVTVDQSDFSVHQTSFTKEFSVPTISDMYILKVLFNGTAQATTTTLQVYGAPEFTSFTIPKAGLINGDGISTEDSTVTARIVGKNFTAPDVTASSFTFSCGTSSVTSGAEATIVSDSVITVPLTICGTAGTYTVTVASGSNSKSGSFVIKDYGTLATGDILCSDGTTVTSTNYATSGKTAVAVVAGFNDYGAAICVGLNQSSSLRWATNGTTGYNTIFTDIVCTPSATGSGVASTATFTGDTDGSDNWDVVCSVDPAGTASDVMATNYPAFNYAVNYGTTNSLPTGYTDGWYMPSLAELCAVYKNMTAINTSITAINKVSSGSATAIGTSWYWSSSQSGSFYSYAWYVNFGSGAVRNDVKGDDYVLVVRAF